MIKDVIMREKRQRSHPLPHACELEKKAVVVVGRPVPQGNLLIHAWRQPHPHKIVGRGGELEYLASGQAGGDVCLLIEGIVEQWLPNVGLTGKKSFILL
jgi:hypothetical protein